MIGQVIASVLMLSGAVLCLIAGIGLHRFDDVFARMHVATKPATLGVILVVLGAGVSLADAGAVAKLVLVVLLVLVTAPTAAHMIGRAAYRSGTELSPDTVLDDVADLDGPADPPESTDPPDA